MCVFKAVISRIRTLFKTLVLGRSRKLSLAFSNTVVNTNPATCTLSACERPLQAVGLTKVVHVLAVLSWLPVSLPIYFSK